ncbi:MAG: single-stranded DNA-binding protein [Ignavibacteria bacterium]|nr:single-stranded DNA-binding protein [Ignavibacteria bacterium]
MARSLNKVLLIGYLGKDPEVKYTEKGDAYCKFSLATTETYRNSEGKDIDRTEWHYVTVWRKLAEICGQYLKKGSRIYMEGRIRTYIDPKDDTKKYTGIEMTELLMLDSKKELSSGSTETAPGRIKDESSSNDDLPF